VGLKGKVFRGREANFLLYWLHISKRLIVLNF
jgi:hypothetical protein